MSNVVTYQVKAAENEYITVQADEWQISRDGLVFYRDGATVAWFQRWDHFRHVEEER